jgi:ABC-type Fe3+ transport system substrate-binding protein
MTSRYYARAWHIAFSLLILPLPAGCERVDNEIQTLVLMSPHRDEIRQEAEQGFRDWLQRQPGWRGTPVRLLWRDLGGGSSQMLRYLTAQYQATPDSCGIDLLYGGGTDLYLDLKPKGILAHYQLPARLAEAIPPELHGVELRDPEGYWYGVMLTSLGILYNVEVLERLGMSDWTPQSWRDLADPRLAGWVSAGDPRVSGNVHMLYEWLLQCYGWEEGIGLLLRLGANARGFSRLTAGVNRDTVMGKAAVSGTLDSYAFTAMAREESDVALGKAPRAVLRMVLPKGEVVLNPDSIGILKGAPHRALAEAFIEYNLSEDGGQQLWMMRVTTDPLDRARFPGAPRRYAICRMGLMERLFDPRVYPPAVRAVSANPFDESMIGPAARKYDNQRAERRRWALQDLFGAWIIDSHEELEAAWRAVLRLDPARRQALERELFAPPCREREIFEVKERFGSPANPRQRAELLSDWLAAARRRYRQIEAAAKR